MKSIKKTLNSLDELRSLDLSSFPSKSSKANEKSYKIENLDFATLDTNDSLDSKISKIKQYDTLSKDQLESPNYKVVISDNTTSFKNKGLSFSNFLFTSNKNNRINSQIIRILSLDGEILKPKDLPLIDDGELDFHRFKNSQRIKRIFGLKSLQTKQTEKWMYRDPVTEDLLFKTNMDILRIYTQKDKINNVLNIVLFDPHHLLATSKIGHFNTKKINNFNVCISTLRKQ